MRSVLFTLMIAIPATALGQAGERQLSILAFDQALPERVLVRSHDPNAGTAIQVLEVPTGKVKKGWFVDTKQAERNKVKRLTRKRYPLLASVDQVEPKGRYTILGAPDGQKKNYQILAMRDGKIGLLATVQLKRLEGTDTYAVGMLKEVVWAPNGKMILCVVNQKLKHSDGLEDRDDVHFVRFRPWKVKWFKPEGEGGEGGAKATP